MKCVFLLLHLNHLFFSLSDVESNFVFRRRELKVNKESEAAAGASSSSLSPTKAVKEKKNNDKKEKQDAGSLVVPKSRGKPLEAQRRSDDFEAFAAVPTTSTPAPLPATTALIAAPWSAAASSAAPLSALTAAGLVAAGLAPGGGGGGGGGGGFFGPSWPDIARDETEEMAKKVLEGKEAILKMILINSFKFCFFFQESRTSATAS